MCFYGQQIALADDMVFKFTFNGAGDTRHSGNPDHSNRYENTDRHARRRAVPGRQRRRHDERAGTGQHRPAAGRPKPDGPRPAPPRALTTVLPAGCCYN
jgi:hypothetical protein